MKEFIFNLLGRREERHKSQSKKGIPKLSNRRLQFEPLESREMLSISPSDIDLLQALNFNVIELKEESLTADALRKAVEISTQTPENDLIILGSTSDKNILQWDDVPLQMDFDSSAYGSLMIVGSEFGQITIDAGDFSSIFQIDSGHVFLENLHFVGNASSAFSTENYIEYFVQISEAADVSTHMIAASIGNPLLQQSGGNFSETKFDDTYGTDFMLDDHSGVFLVGQLENNVADILANSSDYYIEDFFDAEKNGNGDTDLCWAGSASNMLAYTGWGFLNGMTNEDDIFDYFRANFNDVAGNAYYAVEWFLTGVYSPTGWAGWAQLTGDGGNLYGNTQAVRDSYGTIWAEDFGQNFIEGMDTCLRSGEALGLSIGWYGKATEDAEKDTRLGGHAVTVWGYSYEMVDGVKVYTGLFIADPDDDKFDGRDAPNVLAHHAITYDATSDYDGQGYYVFDTYGGTGVAGVIESATTLKQLPNELSQVDLAFNTKSQWNNTSAYFSLSNTNDYQPVSGATTRDSIYLNFSIQRQGNGVAMPSTARITIQNERGENIRTVDVPVSAIDNYDPSNPNASYTRDLRVSLGVLPIGTFTVRIALDADNVIIENNEANNTQSLRISIAQARAPSDFKSTGQTSDSISLSWGVVTGATGYVLQYKKASELDIDSNWVTISNSAAERTAFIDELTSNTMYNFRVKATTVDGDSFWSTLDVKTKIAKPEIPTGLNLKSESFDSLTVEWNNASDAVEYELQYREVGTLLWKMAPISEWEAREKIGEETGKWIVTIENLIPETKYAIRLQARNDGGFSGWTSTIDAETELQHDPPTVPTGFAVADQTTQSITLQWNDADPGTANVQEYELQFRFYNDDDKTWIDVTNPGQGSDLKFELEFNSESGLWIATISNLIASEDYEFRLRAKNNGGVSDWTDSILATTEPLMPPAVPTNFEVKATSHSTIELTWDEVPEVDRYWIYRSTSEDGPFDRIKAITSEITSFEDSGLKASTEYYYYIKTYNTQTKLESKPSDMKSATTEDAPVSPAAPENFTAVALTHKTVKLDWDEVPGADQYHIYRRTHSIGLFVQVGTTTENTFSDPDLEASTTYNYYVKTYDASTKLESVPSKAELVTTLSVPAAPEAPTNLAVSAVDHETVTLTWDDITGIDQYYVYRRTGSTGSFELIETVDENTFTDAGLAPKTTYQYYVTSYDTVLEMESESSEIQTVTTPSAPTPPAAPMYFNATLVSQTSVRLTWNIVSGADRYLVYRRTGTDEFKLVETVDENTFTDINLDPALVYQYYVKSYNSVTAMASPPSMTLTVTLPEEPLEPPIAPAFGVVATSPYSINLAWNVVIGGDQYLLYRREGESGGFELFETVDIYLIGTETEIEIDDINLKPLTTYYYYVTAYNSITNLYSEPSVTRSATTFEAPPEPPAAPTGLTAVANGWDGVNLTWNAVTDADEYLIYRRTGTTGLFEFVENTARNSFDDTNLAESTTYYYQVIAYNSETELVSGPSATVPVTTEKQPALPDAPLNLDVPSVGQDRVTLTWDAVADADQYLIYRRENSAVSFSLIGETEENAFMDTGLSPSTTYYYYVRSYNATTELMSNPSATIRVTTAPQAVQNILAIGADAGPLSKPIVQVYNADTGEFLFEIPASRTYGENYIGGVRVATGDLDGDGIPDIAVAPGSNMAPQILVFNGRNGTLMEEFCIPPSANYGYSFKDGLSIAIGDVVGNGMNDIVLVPSEGQAVVQVFENLSEPNSGYYAVATRPSLEFNAFEDRKEYIGGASVTVGDLDSSTTENKQQIVLGTGPGIEPVVRVYDVDRNQSFDEPVREIKTTSGAVHGGINVAVGDLNGDGVNELIVAAKNGGWSLVEIYLIYDNRSELAGSFQAYEGYEQNNVAVNIVARDSNGDGIDELYMTQGAKGRSGFTIKKVLCNGNLLQPELVDTIFADWSNEDSTGLFLG